MFMKSLQKTLIMLLIQYPGERYRVINDTGINR